MYTGLMFYIDAYLRPVPSEHASAILNNQDMLLVFQALLDSLVPSFAAPSFEALMPHFDELAENLMYFGSYASASLAHDYGRLIPLTMYTSLHNLLAVLPTNTSYPVLAFSYYSSVIAELTVNATNVNITPAHLSAALFNDGTTDRRYHNWFERSLDSLITANAIRVVNATATVSRLFFHRPAQYTTERGFFNPYLFAIGYNYDNREAILQLAASLNDFTHQILPQSKPLRAYTQFGTQEIVRHLSFDSVLPTWHTLTVPENTQSPTDQQKNLFNGVTPPRTPTQFATAISFLIPRPPPSSTGIPPAVPVIRGEQPPAPNNNDVMIQLVAPSTTDPNPTTPLITLFNAVLHVNARAVIFDPASSARSHLAAVMISGKKIEVHDISMIGMPTPHATQSLGLQNSQHVLGAIPIAKTANSGSQAPTIVRRRLPNIISRTAQLFVQGASHMMSIPNFRPGPVTPITAVTPPGTHTTPFLPGVTLINQITNARDGINVFTSQLGSPPANVPDEYYRIWSSYRYYDRETRVWYILPTLRHIYGSRARLSGTQHLSLRLH
jgi:hypothetical protein